MTSLRYGCYCGCALRNPALSDALCCLKGLSGHCGWLVCVCVCVGERESVCVCVSACVSRGIKLSDLLRLPYSYTCRSHLEVTPKGHKSPGDSYIHMFKEIT